MKSLRYKPSKPAAVLGIVAGVGMLVFAIVGFHDTDGPAFGFFVFWCVMVVAITALNTWAAFSKNGSLATFVPFGTTVDEDDDDSPERH